jgi:hypothetical protein
MNVVEIFNRIAEIEQVVKNKIRRTILWLAMVIIVLLFCFSVYGAFIGAERAKEFFNSIPLAIYWFSFILLLTVGILIFQRLRHIPALLMMHIGCIFILGGAVWSSQAGYQIQKRLFGIDKIPAGIIQIFENESENRVQTMDDKIKQLPFSIVLKDFRIEYYEPHNLYIESVQGDRWSLPVKTGAEYELGKGFGSVKIVRLFDKFKMGPNRTVADDPNAGSNPAIEVKVTTPDGQELTRYVFEPSQPFMYPRDELYMAYERTIKDYISTVLVVQDNKVVAEKDVEVNHPLHFGGYHFYQADFDHKTGQYTILRVVSDTGLSTVYFGFILLCLGVIWQFWIKKMNIWLQGDKPINGN